MKKWIPPILPLIPILLIFMLYYVIMAVDPAFRRYVERGNNSSEDDEMGKNEEVTQVQGSDRRTEALRGELAEIISQLPHELPGQTVRFMLTDPLVLLADMNYVYQQSPRELLLLVDKKHALPEKYFADDLVSLDEYAGKLTLNKSGMKLRALLLPHLFAMVEHARSEGVELDISSAYRSFEYQKNLFASHVNTLGQEEALRQSAMAGHSQHQLGTALDFGSISPEFAETEAGTWLSQHACTYGFSLSYPEDQEQITGYMYESWHYRYIGIPACQFEQKYFNGHGQQHMLELFAERDRITSLIQVYLSQSSLGKTAGRESMHEIGLNRRQRRNTTGMFGTAGGASNVFPPQPLPLNPDLHPAVGTRGGAALPNVSLSDEMARNHHEL